MLAMWAVCSVSATGVQLATQFGKTLTRPNLEFSLVVKAILTGITLPLDKLKTQHIPAY
jgi:hypothetical protein